NANPSGGGNQSEIRASWIKDSIIQESDIVPDIRGAQVHYVAISGRSVLRQRRACCLVAQKIHGVDDSRPSKRGDSDYPGRDWITPLSYFNQWRGLFDYPEFSCQQAALDRIAWIERRIHGHV